MMIASVVPPSAKPMPTTGSVPSTAPKTVPAASPGAAPTTTGPDAAASVADAKQAALDSVQALAAELEPSPLRSALEAMAARQKRDLRSRG